MYGLDLTKYGLYDDITPLSQVLAEAKARRTVNEDVVELLDFDGTGQLHRDLVLELAHLERRMKVKPGWRMVNGRFIWRLTDALGDRLSYHLQRPKLERQIQQAFLDGVGLWERNAADGKTLGDFHDHVRIRMIQNAVNGR
jgi:hypothetical protein